MAYIRFGFAQGEIRKPAGEFNFQVLSIYVSSLSGVAVGQHRKFDTDTPPTCHAYASLACTKHALGLSIIDPCVYEFMY